MRNQAHRSFVSLIVLAAVEWKHLQSGDKSVGYFGEYDNTPASYVHSGSVKLDH